jgi:hypothetical protein
MPTLPFSDPVIFALLNVSTACLVLAAMAAIGLLRPALVLIFFFILFAFAWRLCSVLYIDIRGPIFSEQLEREIGPGLAVLPLALAQGIVIAALVWSFRKSRLQVLSRRDFTVPGNHAAGGRFALSDAAFWIAALFVAALWLELSRGPIPFFVAMERYDYARQYGGPLHHLLLQWGPMLAFQLGVFLVAPAFRGQSLDWRFAGLFACLMLYLFLVGHRFASFYSYTSFFIIPVGAAMLGRQPAIRRPLLSGGLFRATLIAGAVFCCLIVAALAHSYLVVRGLAGEQLYEKLAQRILIQQGEMWWMTYERVFVHGDWGADHAADKLFVEPYYPNRNSTMQLLMESALPLKRAHSILDRNSSYSGGWPEVLFELGGPIGAFVMVAVSAFIFAEFMFFLVRCLVEERFATCFFLTPILYGLMIYLGSGMANSFIQLTFALKLAVALLIYAAEGQWRAAVASSIPKTLSNPSAIVPKGS